MPARRAIPERRPAAGRGPRKATATGAARSPWLQLATLALWALVLVPPFIVVPSAVDAFRLPKLLVSETIGLISLLALTFGLLARRRAETPALLAHPALRAVLPLLVLAVASVSWTAHPAVAARAVWALWIGAACWVGWSLGLAADDLHRLLRGLALPAAALSGLALLQLSGLYRPFGLAHGAEAQRIGVTSLAGNAGDLGAYLALPALLAQFELRRTRGAARARWGAALILVLLGLAASQALTAIAAVAVGSLLLWGLELPGRRLAVSVAVATGAALLLVLAVPQFRQRFGDKATALLRGDWNAFLTYRLDGWAAAAWMFRQHPLGGVGHGVYRSEFAAAKLALSQGGRIFSEAGTSLAFTNAHNDLLEVGAELGLLGLGALGWCIAVLVLVVRRLRGHRRALAAGGLAAAAVLALGGFPFETALVAYPWLLFLAWMVACRATAQDAAA